MCGRIYPDSDRHAVGADDNGIPYRPPHGMPFFLPYLTMMRPSLSSSIWHQGWVSYTTSHILLNFQTERMFHKKV